MKKIITVPFASISLLLNLCAQPVPHHFTGITLAPSNTVILSLDGSVSNMFALPAYVSNQFNKMFDLYVLDTSPDLAEWTRESILLRTNSDPRPLLYQETNNASGNARFYRVLTNHLITAFPIPTGRFPVGTVSRILTDPSRSNRYGISTNSSFMSTFWYPAGPPKVGVLPGPYNDKAVAEDRNFYLSFSWLLQWTNLIRQLVAHSFPGVPLANGTNRFPVILHSHGYTCDRMLNSHVAAELASHGYIIAAVDHEDCHATVYPDARGVRYVPPGSLTDLAPLARSRTNDIEYLLGELAHIDNADPVLAGRLDLDRIGTMGMSFGGGTAAEVARIDSRVKCAALLDPYIDAVYDSVLISRGLQKPFLAMNDTIWLHPNNTPSPSDLSDMSQNLFTLAATNATWFKITNTFHTSFTDLAWDMDMNPATRQGSLAIDASVVWFFDTYLKGGTPSFPTNPEITGVQRK